MNVLVLTHVHPARDASKPTRNGSFIIVLPLLLATAFTCADANWIAEGVIISETIPAETKVEILEVILEGCYGYDDAKAD